MPPPVFRFAPSPNGYLHLGHAYSALLNFDLAREAGGRFLLRIEDIDATRCRPEFEAAIYEDLAWLGMSWETPVRRQSEHLARYRAALERLSALGLVYPAFESRAEIARLVAAARSRGAVAARSRRRAALSGRGEIAVGGRAQAADRSGRALCAAARHGGGLRARRRSRAGSSRRRPRRRDRHGRRPAASLGRRHPGAQGDADQLSSVGRDRRRPARRHRSGARPGPVLVDQRAPAAAGSCSVFRNRPTGTTGLSVDEAGQKLSKSTNATGLRELRAAGATPADIRRLVGLAVISSGGCAKTPP